MTEISQALAVADVLEAAAALIEKPGAWTQGAFCRDEFGADIYEAFEAGAEDAVCFCLYGAIGRIVGRDPEGYRDADPILQRALGVASPAAVSGWNDAPGRTQAEVVAALRAAAQKARGRELAAESVK